MSISERNDVSKVSRPRDRAQRLEIFMGAARRRVWTAEQKAAIVGNPRLEFPSWRPSLRAETFAARLRTRRARQQRRVKHSSMERATA